jgi:hypothetical protein
VEPRNKSILMAVIAILFVTTACGIEEEPTPSVTIPQVVQATQQVTVPAVSPTPVLTGACANHYLPILTGAIWNYRLTGADADTFTRSIASVQTDGFTDQDVFTLGFTRQGKWQCSNGNLIALAPSSGSSASIISDGIWIDFRTTAQEGVTLPASINAGNSWTQSLTIEGVQSIYNVQYQARNQLTSNCTAIGIESVTVTAGTFQAMRIDCSTVINISLTIEDKPNQTTLTLTTANWYAENVGLVRTVTTGEGYDGTVELLSYTIP